jgi:hypothetical protein
VQEHGGQQQFGVASQLRPGDTGGIPPDPDNVGQIVRAPDPIRVEPAQQNGREGLVRRDGSVIRG